MHDSTEFARGLPDLEVTRGTDVTIPLVFTNPPTEDPTTHVITPGTPINLTDAIVFFTVKNIPDNLADDELAIVKKDITDHTNPTAGETAIVLGPEDTVTAEPGPYLYDIVLKDSGGKLTSYGMGNLLLNPGITRRDVEIY